MNKVEIAFHKGYRMDREGVLYGVKGGVLSIQLGSTGYQQFTIRAGEKQKNIKAHRLQAYQKFGQEMFRDGIQVRHLNGDKLDNSWDNIAIGTVSDNAMDIPAKVRHATAVQGGRARSPLSVGDVIELRRLCGEEGWKHSELMAKFGISQPAVSRIINRKTWRNI